MQYVVFIWDVLKVSSCDTLIGLNLIIVGYQWILITPSDTATCMVPHKDSPFGGNGTSSGSISCSLAHADMEAFDDIRMGDHRWLREVLNQAGRMTPPAPNCSARLDDWRSLSEQSGC